LFCVDFNNTRQDGFLDSGIDISNLSVSSVMTDWEGKRGMSILIAARGNATMLEAIVQDATDPADEA